MTHIYIALGAPLPCGVDKAEGHTEGRERKFSAKYLENSIIRRTFAANKTNGMFSVKDITEYIVALIAAFAKHYSITEIEAYRYLHQYGAIKIANDFYDVMHTQSFDDMVASMASYCRRKGGSL